MRLAILISFLLILSFSSCEEEESFGECTSAEWDGFYIGTIDCGEETEEVTVTISPEGANGISVFYETDNSVTEYSPVPLEGCNFLFDRSEFGISTTLEGEIDGDNLIIRNRFSGLGTSRNCEIMAVRD